MSLMTCPQRQSMSHMDCLCIFSPIKLLLSCAQVSFVLPLCV